MENLIPTPRTTTDHSIFEKHYQPEFYDFDEINRETNAPTIIEPCVLPLMKTKIVNQNFIKYYPFQPIVILPKILAFKAKCRKTYTLKPTISLPRNLAFAKVIHKLKYRKTEIKNVVPSVQLPATPGFLSVVSMEGTMRSESVNVFQTSINKKKNIFDKSTKSKRPITEERIFGYNLDKMVKNANRTSNE